MTLQYFQPPIPDLDIPKSPRHRRSSDLNHIRDVDRPVHDWYRFVLSYPPHLVTQYLDRFELSPGHCVLDPFCGTGTTVVECKKRGISSVGIEANPMAWFAGSTKLDWMPNPAELLEQAQQIGTIAQAQAQQEPLRSLSEDSAKLLLKNSISELPLHKTLVLLDHLQNPHHKLALAKAIVFSISNLRFAPEVGIGKPKPDAAVVALWLENVATMAQDLQTLQGVSAAAHIHHADSRQVLSVLQPNSIDGVITSPPYPNEKDYTRATRLESVLLGLLKNKADLQALKRGLIRSNSRNVYTTDTDDQWVSRHPRIQAIAEEIETRRREWKKTSGFERVYARAVKLYFGGMVKHLADLRYALRPGAQLAYVVGDQASYLRVMIRTGEILAEIAEGLGYEVVNIDLFRTRLATATKEQLREEVVVLRWKGQMPIAYPFSDQSF
jgi:SAM-dependent methyltransferase